MKDIILQSDRLIDLLRPVDNIVGLLSQTAESWPLSRLICGHDHHHQQQRIGKKQQMDGGKEWASTSPIEPQQHDSSVQEVSLVYVTDAIEPILRAAEVRKLVYVCMYQVW